jgi:trans-aconitate 2-methyltransferase
MAGVNWNPSNYLAFGSERTRAAVDLLARVPLLEPEMVVDLGCGPGNSTEILRRRYPSSHILGLDSSAEMLEQARASGVTAEWVQADVGTWTPPAPVDLLFANAVLHWLPDHEGLFERLLGLLRHGGVLAVQMPLVYATPAHQAMKEVAESGPWAEALRGRLQPETVLRAQDYARMLRDTHHVDAWETEYVHVLKGPDPVLRWVRGTKLLPIKEALPAQQYAAFEAAYAARLREAYPEEEDGRTLMRFPRVFVVAQV